jgi:hypothetical protein
MRNSSEMGRLLERIEAEQRTAKWAMTGISSGSLRHRFITRRMNQIGVMGEQLVTVMGDRDQAMGLIIRRIDTV